MSLYHTGPPRPLAKALVAPAPAPTIFALVKAAVRTHRVADGLFVFAMVILPMVAMIALLFLLGSTDPSTAVPWSPDGTGMLILPP